MNSFVPKGFDEDIAGRFDFDDEAPELTSTELAAMEVGYQAIVAEETARAKADRNSGKPGSELLK